MTRAKIKSRRLASTAPRTVARTALRREWIRVLALFVLGSILAYLPAMQGGFIWDDDYHVTKPELRSLHGLARIWCDLGATQQYYPLLHSAFWVEHKLWGDATVGYHLVNVVLHAAAACLVFVLLRELSVSAAFLAAAIFAFHPVHVESVAWISEQKNTLSAVFYLGALLAYLRFDQTRETRRYFLALGLFVAGLLSKTVTATLPAALLVIFWWQRGALSWRRDVVPLIPFFLLGLVAGLFTAWVEQTLIGAAGADFNLTVEQRCLLAGRVPWFYVSKLIWPANLTFIYPRWEINPYTWWQWLFPAATLAVLAALWMIRRRWRSPLAGVLLFLGMLFPVLGFFNVYPFIYSFVADHFQYLASLGMIVLGASGIAWWVERLLPTERWARLVAGVILVLILASLTSRQCRMYRDVVTLYTTTIERNPACWLAHLNLGTALVHARRPVDALEHFQQALRIRPQSDAAHSNLGILLFQMGRREEGIVHLEEAVRLAPASPEAHLDLANALVISGQAEKAVEHCRVAVQLLPDAAKVRHHLGIALRRANQFEEAASQLERAVLLQPQFPQAYDELARVYADLDRRDDAVAAATAALDTARATQQTAVAQRVETWLAAYRARFSRPPNGRESRDSRPDEP